VNYSCDGDGLKRVMRNVRLIWLSAVTLFLETLLFQLFRFVRIFSLCSRQWKMHSFIVREKAHCKQSENSRGY
jgi:hypothetical protein